MATTQTDTLCTRCSAPCGDEAVHYDEGTACPACDAELLELATDLFAYQLAAGGAEPRFDFDSQWPGVA